mmetsp:Transcript_13853/g.43881  ORF Transcript_13853/g.43881 Transcript_13853/m.43881 type:complete len:474 (-) Transcript_13853:235-1656(-)
MDVIVAADDGSGKFGKIIRSEKFRSQDGVKARARLVAENNGKGVPVNTARFVYHIKDLNAAVTKNETEGLHDAKPQVSSAGEYVYPDFKIGDLIGGAVKMVVCTHGNKIKYGDLKRAKDIVSLLSYVRAMDADKKFSSYASFCNITSTAMHQFRSVNVMPRMRVAVCCMDDKASVDALRMIERLLRPECDLLHLITVTRVFNQKDYSDAFAVLDLFQPSNRRQETDKRVLTIEDMASPVDAVKNFVNEMRIDLLVLSSHGEIGNFAKNCLVHVRCPMLICKSGAKEKLVEPPGHERDAFTEQPALKFAAMVNTNSRKMIDFMPKLLDVRKDSLVLLLPGHKDPTRQQLLLSNKILTTLERQSVSDGMATRSRMVYSNTKEENPKEIKASYSSFGAHIFAFRLPITEILPDEALEHIKIANCPVLCYRRPVGAPKEDEIELSQAELKSRMSSVERADSLAEILDENVNNAPTAD